MPFKSKDQWRKFFAMANRGEISKKKAKEWARETKTPFKRLPEKVKKTKKNKKTAAMLKLAAEVGRQLAMQEAPDVEKVARSAVRKMLFPALAGLGVGAASGALLANALSAEKQSKNLADNLREGLATLPPPLLAELMMQGMSPGVASHILAQGQPQKAQ